MANDLDAYFAGLRAGELAAYLAEIKTKEVEFWAKFRPTSSSVEAIVDSLNGESAWNYHYGLNILTEIDHRHGVAPDDPRVYSIAAFLTEMKSIERVDSRRRLDCEARHFPGLISSSEHLSDRVESKPKLWRHLKTKEHTTELLYKHNFLDERNSRSFNEQFEKDVLKPMTMLGILWTPQSPVEHWRLDRFLNEIRRIINRLEHEDAEAIRTKIGFGLPVGPGSNQRTLAQNVAKAPQRTGRVSDTDHASDRRIFEAWSTGLYGRKSELATEKGLPEKEIKNAIDRHRKRLGPKPPEGSQ